MPELPDVEIFKRYLDATALHQKIKQVDFGDESLFQAPLNNFEEALQGKELTETTRKGKYLFVKIKSEKWLVLHFGMTGYLKYYKDQDKPAHTQMLLSFSNGFQLAYICVRKLGKVFLTQDLDEFYKKHDLGEDALDFTKKDFDHFLESKTGSIKGALMDQSAIAGIGNIYADEILFQSKIHPKTKVENITGQKRQLLYDKMKSVLKMAIVKGADISELPKDYLISHREEGSSCPICKGKIKKIKVNGRSTYFCPQCQKE